MKIVDKPDILVQESISRSGLPLKHKKISKFFDIATSIVVYTSILGMAGPDFISSTKILIDSYKTNAQITEDAKIFDADMKIAHYHGDSSVFLKSYYKRMPHNDTEPIFVNIDENFSNDEKNLIGSALNYYQDLFSSINSKYYFHIVDKPMAILEKFLGKTVIYINENNTMTNYGVNKFNTNMFSTNFISQTEISVKDLPETEKQAKNYVLLHELAHAFGLGDVYRTITPIEHADTFMAGSVMAYKIKMLFPNDVAMLYSMYGENYRNKNNLIDNEVLKSVNSFEDYKTKFYSKVANEFVSYYNLDESVINKINDNDVINSNLVYTSNNYTYKIKVKAENKADYSIFDSDNNFVYKTETEYENRNGILFFPSLHLEKGFYPNNKINISTPETIQMLSILSYDNNYKLINVNDLSVKNIELIETTHTNEVKNNKTDLESKYPSLNFVDAVEL